MISTCKDVATVARTFDEANVEWTSTLRPVQQEAVSPEPFRTRSDTSHQSFVSSSARSEDARVAGDHELPGDFKTVQAIPQATIREVPRQGKSGSDESPASGQSGSDKSPATGQSGRKKVRRFGIKNDCTDSCCTRPSLELDPNYVVLIRVLMIWIR